MPRYPARRRRRISDDVVALITQARREHEFGASRTRIWLERVHHVRVATETIQRVFRDIGVPHLVKTRRRRPKQLKLFEKERPGDSVQVDVKVVTRGRKKWFQYTAIVHARRQGGSTVAEGHADHSHTGSRDDRRALTRLHRALQSRWKVRALSTRSQTPQRPLAKGSSRLVSSLPGSGDSRCRS